MALCLMAIAQYTKRYITMVYMIATINTCGTLLQVYNVGMAKERITYTGYQCERCQHVWIPRNQVGTACLPKCRVLIGTDRDGLRKAGGLIGILNGPLMISACSGPAGKRSLFVVAWASRRSAALGRLLRTMLTR